jgi:hypothetical protein
VSLGLHDVLSVIQKPVLANITNQAKSLVEQDMATITKIALQAECDRLVKDRDALMKENIPLWNVLSGTNSTRYDYGWAQKRLEQNEEHIRQIETRLAKLKELEQENPDLQVFNSI